MSTEQPGVEVTAIVPTKQEPTPMSILAKAVEMGADVDKLTKLMDLQERWERNEAKKAFDAALAACRHEVEKHLA